MTDTPAPIILSFDVEEHHRIEAAAGLTIAPEAAADYGRRMDEATHRLLDELGCRGLKATFYVVGEISHSYPDLIRRMAREGHEVGCHSWDHRRVVRLSPDEFRDDVRRSKEALEDLVGEPVVGYRAPTFSIGRKTPWAIDILAEVGYHYDSSIYPVRHDRYGEPNAPRGPFWVRGLSQSLLELPPLTWRWLGGNLPVGGGGYFRLFPLALLERGLAQVKREGRPPVAMLYFHPWEFDPDQPRLPLGRLSSFRTYVGTRRSRLRLGRLLDRHSFTRAIDVVTALRSADVPLPTFDLQESTIDMCKGELAS